jgi:L-asparaginase II
MRAAPYLVAGKDRLDTDLMRVADHIVSKEGAEALVCAADLSSGLGVAVKIADGGHRAAPPAILHALEELGALDVGDLERLGRHTRPAVLGGGEPVGVLEPMFHLRRKR